jgi:rRNA maturation endonuclease Nob1
MSAETDDEMDLNDFYNDRKFCTECAEYVTYLQSMEHSYCTQCGSQVRLFSQSDWEAFNESLKERRPKGGRPRKKRESA